MAAPSIAKARPVARTYRFAPPALYQPEPHLRVRRTTNQSITSTGGAKVPVSTAWEWVSFDTVDEGSGIMWTKAAPTYAVMRVRPGIYECGGVVQWALGGVGGITVHMRLVHSTRNGVDTEFHRTTQHVGDATTKLMTQISQSYGFASGDRLRVGVQHDLGSAVNIEPNGKFSIIMFASWRRDLPV
jgi:hypothetical protein